MLPLKCIQPILLITKKKSWYFEKEYHIFLKNVARQLLIKNIHQK